MARALGNVAIPHKDTSFVDVARTAINALKTQIPYPSGPENLFKARSIAEFNAMLDSILTEKQGE